MTKIIQLPAVGQKKSEMLAQLNIDTKYSVYSAAVLEASACGTPCVASNVCGVTEWMDDIIKVNPNEESIVKGVEKGLSNENIW